MVPTLLWRCPLCKAHDALVQKPRWFRPDLVQCVACGTVWELIRIIGGQDYQMQIVHGRDVGLRRPLADWYDLVKADLQLEAIADPALPLDLAESLYLTSKTVEVVARRDDPFFDGVPVSAPIPPRLSEDQQPILEPLGLGALGLTDQRLIVEMHGHRRSLWLKSLSAVWLERDRFLIVRVHGQVYLFRFLEESLLKWLTYLRLAIEAREAVSKPRVHFAYD